MGARSRKLRRGIGFVVVLLFLTILLVGNRDLYAQGQLVSASLAGTVFDHSGAAIPGATVTLSSVDRGFSQNFKTDSGGRYVFTLLQPGRYSLKVEQTGFQTYLQSGIIVAVGESARQDVTLEIGGVKEVLTVTSNVSPLQTSDANVSAEVNQKQVVELPLNIRNVFGLVQLNSSVNNSTQFQALGGGEAGVAGAEQNVGFFNFGGSRMGDTAILLDGVWDAMADILLPIYVPTVDDTQEFKIQSNSFTAQYGWSMGNVVNVISKGGTRGFHGDVYDFLRNDVLDANNFFNNATGIARPLFMRSQFGVTAGGPLYIPKLYQQRDKTFIFGEFEGLREGTPYSLLTTIPTTDFRQGNFSALLGGPIGTDCLGRNVLAGQLYNPFTTRKITSGLTDPVTGAQATCSGYIRDPFQGNIIPSSMFDKVANNILSNQGQNWPNPTSGGTSNNFSDSLTPSTKQNGYSIRVDHNISDKARFFARWGQRFESTPPAFADEWYGPNDKAGPGANAPNNRWAVSTGYTRVFSPTLVMSINGGYQRMVEQRVNQSSPFTLSSLGLPSYLDTPPGQFPYMTIDGTYALGQSQPVEKTPREAGSLSLDFTKTRGEHTLKFGTIWVPTQLPLKQIFQTEFNFPVGMTQGPDPTAANPQTGWGFASFLLGTGNSGAALNPAGTSSHDNWYGWYFQDDWKASHKLTLNLGLRYEIQRAPTERYNRFNWFDYTATNPISSEVGLTVPGELEFTGGPNRRGMYDPQYTNFAPRLGLTYLVTNKLVMRTGFGMFYAPALNYGTYQGLSEIGFSETTPYVGTVDGITPQNLLGNPFPGGLITPPGKSQGGLTNVGLSVGSVSNFRPTPYVTQWTYGLQYELSPNTSIAATYVGNHGVKLLSAAQEENQLPPSDLAKGTALLNAVSNPFYPYITTSGCGLDQPTVTAGQLLRPYPEFCGVDDVENPDTFSFYNAVTFEFNHRWSKGMQLVASYTISKYESNSEGQSGWAVGSANGIRDYYNVAAEKSLDGADIPQSLVLNYIYELPVGRGKHFGAGLSGPLNAIVGGWQVSGITTFKSGFPLSITTSDNSGSLGDGGQRPNLVGDPHISNPTINKWFNTAAFAQPAAYTFGNVGRTMPNLRAPGINNWDLAIQKWWNWRERLRVQFRAEMFNAFNHANFFAPDQFLPDASFGTITEADPARDIQFGLKVYW
jgi:hypothetical protein